MASPNFQNRTLFHSDNLPILQGMDSETVDLIATDPPFNKGRDFHATPDSLARGARFQDRWSWDNDVHESWTDAIQDDYPAVWSVIQFARQSYGDDMGAFLCFMGVRLMEMHRILKPTGSLYLHCDPTASHYLKAMMDAVFGRRQFRNEIVWGYPASPSPTKRDFPRKHDVILRYSKSSKWVFNADAIRVPYAESSKERVKYAANASTVMSGQEIKLQEGGKLPPSIWTDIQQAYRYRSEITGYPTQKPLALYERIIKASSNPGDIVLDPFSGCATTPIAAERLERQWVAIDLWEEAYNMVLQRLRSVGLALPDGVLSDPENPNLLTDRDVHLASVPPERTDDGDDAAPILRLRVQRPVFAWQKLSRNQMAGILGEAQASPNDPRLIVCPGCGRMMEMPFMELDHIQPKSDRGSNAINNRILLCGPCNREKGAERTLRGLINDNRKSGWTIDGAVAESARLRAERMAERVELEWDSGEIQALAEKHR